MAIKIIKEGKKEFCITCRNCGCEFTYEIEDISGLGFVNCPTCDSNIAHRPGISGTIGWPGDIIAIPCDNLHNKETNPCANCDWLKNLKPGEVYVGDTPCTWCKHNQFTCSTSQHISGITATNGINTKISL